MDSVKNGAAWVWNFVKLAYEIVISAVEHFPQTSFWVWLGLLAAAVYF